MMIEITEVIDKTETTDPLCEEANKDKKLSSSAKVVLNPEVTITPFSCLMTISLHGFCRVKLP